MGVAELSVLDFAGLVIGQDGETAVGRVVENGAVPMGLRRRMPKFALAAVRCAMGVAAPGAELVFASRYGDVPTALALSEAIVAADLLSPSAFSACVHNAAPGLAAQILGEKSSHTAVAAGADSLAAGLLEAWLRIEAGETREAVVLFAEGPMPEIYAGFEHEPGVPGVALAVRVGPQKPAGDGAMAHVQPGRAGALALLEALEGGAGRLGVRPRFGAAA
ncbi:MAG: beta-ketoacyl synthase chain length factor [Caulobacter sp.]